MIPADETSRWEWIENYIEGRLSEKDKAEVENEMNKNQEFRTEVGKVRQAWKLVHDAATEQIVRDTLIRFRTQKDVRVIPLRRRHLIVSLTATLTAACIGFLVFLMVMPVNLPSSEYDIKVLRAVDPMQLSEKQHLTYETFFEGQARLTEGKYTEAVVLFKKVSADRSLRPYFIQAAEWHLCIAMFKSGNFREAEILLKNVSARSRPAYSVGWLERWKMWIQIQLKKW